MPVNSSIEQQAGNTQTTIDNLKLALKATGMPPASSLEMDSVSTTQKGKGSTSMTRNLEAQTSAEIQKQADALEDPEERIQFFAGKIDEQIVDLDQKLDHVLEKHEKDFLKAYRVQMLKVQDELS